MKSLDTKIDRQPYKKIIAWTKSIRDAEEWYDLFNKHKADNKRNVYKYKYLHNITPFIDHSKADANEYIEFRDTKTNSILFCVNKHKEGSDIPYLDTCIFLDFVVNRSCKDFIQCIGRVLRIFKNKKYGLIFDGIIYNRTTNVFKDMVIKKIVYYMNSLNNINNDIIELPEIINNISIKRTNIVINFGIQKIKIFIDELDPNIFSEYS